MVIKCGITSFIIPNSWLNNIYLKTVRSRYLEKSEIHDVVQMPSSTFADANVDTIIITFSHKEKSGNKVKLKKCSHIFCEDCIQKWLKNHKNTCPICRVNVIIEPEINQDNNNQ